MKNVKALILSSVTIIILNKNVGAKIWYLINQKYLKIFSILLFLFLLYNINI